MIVRQFAPRLVMWFDTARGNPWIAYGDQRSVKVAVWDGTAWSTSTVATRGNNALGHIVSLALDGDGKPHVAYSEITSDRPLNGVVHYATLP